MKKLHFPFEVKEFGKKFKIVDEDRIECLTGTAISIEFGMVWDKHVWPYVKKE